MAIRIPEQHERPFGDLLLLSDEDEGVLCSALSDATPAISAQALARQVSSRVDIPVDQLTGMLAVLVSLTMSRDYHKISTDRIVHDAILQAKEEGIGPFADPETPVDPLKNRLIKLLSSSTALGITSRAVDIMTQHQNPFDSARVLTDVRYIFSQDDDPQPLASMIVHSLNLTTYSDGDLVSNFVALDSEDLRSLQAAIERALQKERTLEDMLRSSGIPYIPVN
jgi:hypothetical protein